MKQFDLWKSRDGYTIGLESETLMDITDDELRHLITETCDLHSQCKADGNVATELGIGDESVVVNVDSLPVFIATMIDLLSAEIPDSFSDTDSLYRCLTVDLEEDDNNGEQE